MAVADYVLQHTPGNTVSNLSSTRGLRDVTEKYGCNYTPAAVGEVNVVTKMKETGAVIGGEGNGGVIYPAAHSGGAFSPIGDVTTIMLWNTGLITAPGVIKEILVPSIISMMIPALLLQTKLKGNIKYSKNKNTCE